MAILELAPIAALLGTLISSTVGVRLDRRRVKEEAAEPIGASDAAAGVINKLSEGTDLNLPSVHGQNDAVLVSSQELKDAISVAVRQVVEESNKRAERTSLKSSTAFFIAGILATVAITLFIHPLQ